MKHQNYIFRGLGLFLSIFMLGIVFSKDLTEIPASQEVPVHADGDEEGQNAVYSELSSDYVIPSFAFDFGSDFELLPALTFTVAVAENIFKVVTKPVFRISYFEKLFEHHIAINAP
mgnify:CR=1 FL=1